MIILVASCSKESISPTQAQVTATKLKTALGPYKFTNISVYYNNIGTVTDAATYSITDDGFIQVANDYFNLEQLKFYQISPPILALYF